MTRERGSLQPIDILGCAQDPHVVLDDSPLERLAWCYFCRTRAHKRDLSRACAFPVFRIVADFLSAVPAHLGEGTRYWLVTACQLLGCARQHEVLMVALLQGERAELNER